jgi:hypothetical protein
MQQPVESSASVASSSTAPETQADPQIPRPAHIEHSTPAPIASTPPTQLNTNPDDTSQEQDTDPETNGEAFGDSTGDSDSAIGGVGSYAFASPLLPPSHLPVYLKGGKGAD